LNITNTSKNKRSWTPKDPRWEIYTIYGPFLPDKGIQVWGVSAEQALSKVFNNRLAEKLDQPPCEEGISFEEWSEECEVKSEKIVASQERPPKCIQCRCPLCNTENEFPLALEYKQAPPSHYTAKLRCRECHNDLWELIFGANRTAFVDRN